MQSDELILQRLEANAQALLIEFLSADLDLCRTFLETATETNDPDHRASALAKVRTAVASIRQFSARVEDAKTKQSIEERLDDIAAKMPADGE